MIHRLIHPATLLSVLLLALPAAAAPGLPERTAPREAEEARPREAEETRPRKAEEAGPRKTEEAGPGDRTSPRPQAEDARRTTPRRRARRELPGDPDNGLPALERDPFQPPRNARRGSRPSGVPAKRRPWFIRPSLMFVARFSPDRSFLPQEGFGFGVQAGAILGTGSLRVSLSINYHFYRVARSVEITVGSPQLISCTDVRSISHHLATASASAVAMFSRVTLWAGLRGGFAYGELNNVNDSCGTDETNVPTGTIGPEVGFGYALKRDLYLGVNLAYLHFFSDEAHTDESGLSARVFYPLLTAGAHMMLRF